MIKLLTVVGARPQIIKAAALSRAIKNNFQDSIKEMVLHTGQHYDPNMSQVFFDELEIPMPDFNLNVGSASHGVQTARMIEGIEKTLLDNSPDFLVLYGDTNSTLAGAIAASKIHVPIIHIEAGLRSFNKSMPEEINRIMCDHASTLLFSPTETGVNNLISEGFKINTDPPFSPDNPAVFHCGDVMYDNSLFFAEKASKYSKILTQHRLIPGSYILGTLHRDHNTDDPARLGAIFESVNRISVGYDTEVILPLHPRTSKMLKTNLSDTLLKKTENNRLVKITGPVSFLDMIQLEKNAKLILTDSGGVQKESYFFRKPCIILRPQTEWIEIVKNGTAIIANADKNKILEAYEYFNAKKDLSFPPVFGDGKAGKFICQEIIENSIQNR
nr:UDP-N-acetylglucosamine 2-epimerase (non-hydrolyzing) [Bacteroidota bacterium]